MRVVTTVFPGHPFPADFRFIESAGGAPVEIG